MAEPRLVLLSGLPTELTAEEILGSLSVPPNHLVVHLKLDQGAALITCLNAPIAQAVVDSLNRSSLRNKIITAEIIDIPFAPWPVQITMTPILQQAFHAISTANLPPPGWAEQGAAVQKLAGWIIAQGAHGVSVEAVIHTNEAQNPLFSFLFGGPHYDFYRWQKLLLCLHGLFPGGANPPRPLTDLVRIIQVFQIQLQQLNFVQHLHLLSTTKQIQNELASQLFALTSPSLKQSAPPITDATLSPKEQSTFSDLLKGLRGTTDSIGEAKEWILSHSDHAEAVVGILLSALNSEHDPQAKLHFLFLISDVLHCGLKSRGREGELDSFSKSVQKKLEELVIPVFRYQHEKIKQGVMKVLNLWEERNIFDVDTLSALKQILHKDDPSEPQHPPPQQDFQPRPPQAFQPAFTQFPGMPPPGTFPAMVPPGQFPMAPTPSPGPKLDPNYNLPVGILVAHFGKFQPAPYTPLKSDLLDPAFPLQAPDPHLISRYEEFLKIIK